MSREVWNVLCTLIFFIVVLEGIAENKEKYLLGAYFIGGGGVLLSGASIWALVYVFLLGFFSWFLVKGFNFWEEGVGIYKGEEDCFCRPTCAYKIKVRNGERYIIVKLNNGKTYYYEDIEEFENSWDISEDFYEIRAMLGLTESIDCDEKGKDVRA